MIQSPFRPAVGFFLSSVRLHPLHLLVPAEPDNEQNGQSFLLFVDVKISSGLIVDFFFYLMLTLNLLLLLLLVSPTGPILLRSPL